MDELDRLIWMRDCLEHCQQFGFDRMEYQQLHNRYVQENAGLIYDDTIALLRNHGSPRAAFHYLDSRIEREK